MMADIELDFSKLLNLLISCAYLQELVYEKQLRLKETMKMMGLANWIHWMAWFIKELSFMLIPVIVMTLIAVFGEVFRRSDGLIIFIFFFAFLLSGISFLFMLSTFFSTARLGMICGYLFWFVSFFPYLIVSGDNIYPDMNRHTKSVACLMSTMCMGFGSRQILIWESRNVGVKWSNIGDPPSVDDDFSVGAAIGMMILDTVLYLIIAWYVEAVFPGDYGIPQPWYFPVTSSYWFGKPSVSPDDTEANIKISELNSSSSREADPNLPVGISIRNLTKVYKSHGGSHKLAVDGLSLNMFKGQITSLLGHNGAGKTTTMSVITGLFPPTSGEVVVNGHSVATDIDKVRESLGLCPQHNVLFDRLTVKEHLKFFIQLKVVSSLFGNTKSCHMNYIVGN
jgi:ABC-type multidrug transport system fused ATPase/permease subunit